jgi:DNA-directed RNA polymerase subunit K/omega
MAASTASASQRTSKYLSHYEYAEVVATRVSELCHGATPLVDWQRLAAVRPARGGATTHAPGVEVAMAIARAELEAGVLPYTVRRRMLDATFEDWPLASLRLPPGK